MSLVLGPDDHLSLHGEKGQSTLEAMRLLPAGRYSLGTQSQGATLKSLVVRSIPEIVYSRLLPKPYRPWMSAFGPYDWEFHRRVGVLANANVIMSRDDVPPDSDHASYMEEWASQGKKWVTEEGTKSDYLEPETVLGWWLKLPGMRLPKTWGIFLDEGLPRTEELSRAWIGARVLLYDLRH